MTLVHLAVFYGLYSVVDYMIEELGFKVDYYEPEARLTLLHVVAKHRTAPFLDNEKEHIKALISKSNNLTLRNNFNKTVLSLATTCNTEANTHFLRDTMRLSVVNKVHRMAWVLDKQLQR